jgi:hypothetical protein
MLPVPGGAALVDRGSVPERLKVVGYGCRKAPDPTLALALI